MWLLIAEAFIALGMLVFIVWWTMSSRRKPAAQVDAEPAAAKTAVAAEPSSPPAAKIDSTQADRNA